MCRAAGHARRDRRCDAPYTVDDGLERPFRPPSHADGAGGMMGPVGAFGGSPVDMHFARNGPEFYGALCTWRRRRRRCRRSSDADAKCALGRVPQPALEEPQVRAGRHLRQRGGVQRRPARQPVHPGEARQRERRGEEDAVRRGAAARAPAHDGCVWQLRYPKDARARRRRAAGGAGARDGGQRAFALARHVRLPGGAEGFRLIAPEQREKLAKELDGHIMQCSACATRTRTTWCRR